MDVVRYVFYMGVIQIVFSTFWKFIATLLSGLLESFGINKDFSFLLFKSLGYYILVSVSALVTWDMMVQGGPVTAALVAAFGVFIMYSIIAGNLERNRWRAVMNFERKRIQVMRFDGYLLIGSILLFLVTLGLPEIARNPVNEGIRTFIDQVYKLPVIGWIVGLGAFFYMLHITYKGLKATDYVMQLLFRTEGNRRTSNGSFDGRSDQNSLPEDEEYIDYVEIRENDRR